MPKMHKTDEITFRERLKAGVLGLAAACPYDQGNPANCQLCNIRKKELRDRLEWVQSLSLDDMLQIVTVHQVCVAYREGECQKPTASPVTTQQTD